MATTQCPLCSLTVPYFCCEGLVCPACGYDEGQEGIHGQRATEQSAPTAVDRQPRPCDPRASQPPAQ